MSAEGRLLPAEAVVDAALGAAKLPCVVLVEEGSSAEVRFANNTTTTNGTRRQRRVAVVCFGGTPEAPTTGVASGSGGVEVTELVARAEADAARATPADDASELLTPETAGHGPDDLALEPEETSISAIAPLLPELGAGFSRGKIGGHVLAGFITHEVDTLYLATSTGIRRRHVEAAGSVELVARSRDGARSAWAATAGEEFAVGSLTALEDKLLERLDWARRRIDLPAGRYETILPADAVADLVFVLAEAAGGRDAEDGRSVFSAPGGATRVGERLFPLPFRLLSDPDAAGLACRPFLATGSSGSDVSVFDNGAQLSKTAWIEDGTLSRLRYHRAGARRSNVPFTPPIDNLILELSGAQGGLDKLVGTTERGLLLTCLWYIREVDPSTLLLTGLTRDGVYLVEGGEVVGAVNNFRFNESPVDVLARATEATATERAVSREWGEWMHRSAMPALRVAEFNMSSVSPAS